MQIFGKKRAASASSLAKAITAAEDRRARVEARLAAALAVAQDREAAARSAALAGADDNTLDAAEANVRDAQQRVATLRDALAAAQAEVDEARQKHAVAADQETRQTTAAQVGTIRSEFEAAIGKFDVAIAELPRVGEQAGLVVAEARGLGFFCANARNEVNGAAGLIGELLDGHGAAVIAGTAPAVLPNAEAPPAPKAKPIERHTVWPVTDIKWKQGDGETTACKCFPAHLPVPLAKRALEKGLAIEMGSPQQIHQQQFHSWRPAYPETCVSIEDGTIEEPSRDSGIVHAAFDPEERIESIGVASVMRGAA